MKRNKFNIPICDFDKFLLNDNFIYHEMDFYFNYWFQRYIKDIKSNRILGFGIFLKKSEKFV